MGGYKLRYGARGVAGLRARQDIDGLVWFANQRGIFGNQRWLATDALAQLGTPSALDGLLSVDAPVPYRISAAQALATSGVPGVDAALQRLLDDEDVEVRAAAQAALDQYRASPPASRPPDDDTQAAPGGGQRSPTLAFRVGHKVGEYSERVGVNQTKVTSTYQTFPVMARRPETGVTRMRWTCPECSKSVGIGVPSFQATRRRVAVTVAVMVGCVLGVVGIAVANGFEGERLRQGMPFATMLLLGAIAFGFLMLLVWLLDNDGVTVRGTTHKKM